MSYTLHVGQSSTIPCADHAEQEVFYTARIFSKYKQKTVDVYKGNCFVASFVNGKISSRVKAS